MATPKDTVLIGSDKASGDEELFYTNLMSSPLTTALLRALRDFELHKGYYDERDRHRQRSTMQTMVLGLFECRPTWQLNEAGASHIPWMKKTGIFVKMKKYLDVPVDQPGRINEDILHGLLDGIMIVLDAVWGSSSQEVLAQQEKSRIRTAPQGPRQRKPVIVIKPLGDSVPVTEEEKEQHKDKPAPSTAQASP
jgi:hypothetical protein